MSTAAIASKILFAGYGVYNQTGDATTAVTNAYNNGQRIFLANNGWIGDPAPGERKYLYITWEGPSGEQSGVTGENDGRGISVP
jgi:hypothetical protein